MKPIMFPMVIRDKDEMVIKDKGEVNACRNQCMYWIKVRWRNDDDQDQQQFVIMAEEDLQLICKMVCMDKTACKVR